MKAYLQYVIFFDVISQFLFHVCLFIFLLGFERQSWCGTFLVFIYWQVQLWNKKNEKSLKESWKFVISNTPPPQTILQDDYNKWEWGEVGAICNGLVRGVGREENYFSVVSWALFNGKQMIISLHWYLIVVWLGIQPCK